MLADNVSEFADDDTIATLLGEREGESKPSTASQPGPAERRAQKKCHMKSIKLPKSTGVRFDRLAAANCVPLKSQVNSEPREVLGFLMSLNEKALLAIYALH